MFGTVRGLCTLAGAGAAGFLIWLSTQVGRESTGGYWAAIGLLAGAGLTTALSQLFGGWTKWGMPRISAGVFLIGFLPVLVVAGWVILAGQPDTNWFQRHVNSWSGSIAIDGPVHDLGSVLAVLAFGVGLVFGFTFDTAGPRKPGEPIWESAAPVEPAPVPAEDPSAVTVHDVRASEAAPEPDTARERVPTGRT
ncbi:MAG: hypothetical protein ACM3QU_06075 [Verrucomicrobiota bacterium]